MVARSWNVKSDPLVGSDGPGVEHREIVVYDHRQVYPELEIRFEVVCCEGEASSESQGTGPATPVPAAA